MNDAKRLCDATRISLDARLPGFVNQQKLTQNMLVARVEVLNFFGITRDVLSNIELQKYVATDKHVYFLAKALKVEIAELFRP